jgi:hypothetical protein
VAKLGAFDWDAASVKGLRVQELQQIWEVTLSTGKCRHSEREKTFISPDWPTYVMVGDASTAVGCGFNLLRWYDGDLLLVDQDLRDHQTLWQGTDQPTNIYQKEMSVAINSLVWFQKKFPGHRVTLVTDNSAVAWGLRSGFTTHQWGQQQILKIVDTLQLVHVVQVVSEDNPADCVSRDSFVDFPSRLARLKIALLADREGRRTGIAQPYRGVPDARLRHAPPNDDTEVECWLGQTAPPEHLAVEDDLLQPGDLDS